MKHARNVASDAADSPAATYRHSDLFRLEHTCLIGSRGQNKGILFFLPKSDMLSEYPSIVRLFSPSVKSGDPVRQSEDIENPAVLSGSLSRNSRNLPRSVVCLACSRDVRLGPHFQPSDSSGALHRQTIIRTVGGRPTLRVHKAAKAPLLHHLSINGQMLRHRWVEDCGLEH